MINDITRLSIPLQEPCTSQKSFNTIQHYNSNKDLIKLSLSHSYNAAYTCPAPTACVQQTNLPKYNDSVINMILCTVEGTSCVLHGYRKLGSQEILPLHSTYEPRVLTQERPHLLNILDS